MMIIFCLRAKQDNSSKLKPKPQNLADPIAAVQAIKSCSKLSLMTHGKHFEHSIHYILFVRNLDTLSC